MNTIEICGIKVDPSLAYVHGNGFIQVPVDSGSRLHVWHPSVPRQSVYSGLHNHRFGFTSHILYGCLINSRYYIVEADDRYGNLELMRGFYPVTRDGQDTELIEMPKHFHVCPVSEEVYHPGESYSIEPGEFHTTHAPHGLAVTIMYKDEVKDINPMVLCDQTPDNDFDRYAHSDIAQMILREMSLLP